MPNRFVRIRYYGIYHHRTKQSFELKFNKFNQETHNLTNKPAKTESRAERIIRITSFDPSICPECKQAKMLVIKNCLEFVRLQIIYRICSIIYVAKSITST